MSQLVQSLPTLFFGASSCVDDHNGASDSFLQQCSNLLAWQSRQEIFLLVGRASCCQATQLRLETGDANRLGRFIKRTQHTQRYHRVKLLALSGKFAGSHLTANFIQQRDDRLCVILKPPSFKCIQRNSIQRSLAHRLK